jgi:parallel beta-helix repeat protein
LVKWLRNHRLIVIVPLLLVMLAIIPVLTMGLTWVQSSGILSADAVVFASDAPAMDRFMARALGQAYGDRIAVCDGTADQIEIQEAIDAFATTGGKLLLSSGSFHDNASIEIPQTGGYSYISIMGNGPSTVLRSDAADAIADHFIKCASEAARNMYVDLQNFRIEGTNQAANAGSDSSGIKLWGASYSHISNLTIQNCLKYGAWFNCDAGTAAIDFRLVDSKISANGSVGVVLGDSNTDVTIEGCNIYGNTSYGIWVGGAGGVIIDSNRMYSNGNANIYTNGTWTQIVGNNLSGDHQGVKLGSNADRSIINGNVIQYSDTYGVEIGAGADYCVVEGNHFYDNDGVDVYNDGSGNVISGNYGYISRGETRTYSVTITAGVEDTTTYFQNPFKQNVWVTEVTLNLTTAASATAPTYDIKIDADGAGVPDGAALLDGVPDTVATYWSWGNVYGAIASGVQTGYVQLASNASTSDWIGLCIEDAAGSDSAGVFYVTLMGQ